MSEKVYVTNYGNQATWPKRPEFKFEHFPLWLQPTFAALKSQHDESTKE